MAEKEYIEREAVYKACEAYFKGVCGYDVSESEVIDDFIYVINSVPMADVVPIIRCKDCKYYREMYKLCSCRHDKWNVYLNEDDYCSRGERRGR